MNVLVVEDDEPGSSLLQRILGKVGHRTIAAAHGVEALELLRQERVDAIITDIMMPQMDGFRLCQAVRQDERLASIPLIVYTANYSSNADEKLALDLGADAFLRKPAPAESIRETLIRVTSQPRVARPVAGATAMPEPEVMRLYSDRLVAKLEERNHELLLANDRLRESEERFAKVFQASPAALSVVTVREGRLLMVNDRYCKFFGYSFEELIGRTVMELGFYADAGQHAALLERLLTEGTVRGHEVRLQCKDGTVREVLVVMDLFHYPGVSEPVVISMFTDITERKRVEAALASTSALLERTAEIARVGGWELDLRTMKVSWSLQTCRLHEVDPPVAPPLEQAIKFYAPEARPVIHAAVQAGMDRGTPWDLELPLITAKGRPIWVRAQGFAEMKDGKVVKLLGTFQDITERRQLENQLRQSQKMEAVGQLAGGIAHDFNNILGAILGNAELLRIMPAGSKEAGESLDAIIAASRRAGDLVRQILAFSRRQQSHREPAQLHRVVSEALKLLRATVPTTVEFRSNIAVAPAVLANASEIHQVTMNLCTNAWHALPGGTGAIQVELAEVEVDEALARQQPDLRPGRHVRMAVTDNGCGMDEATLARIFDPFFTTKPVGVGTGLGLAVVHGIVRSHEGGIVVSSQPGQGTTFALYFPVCKAAVVEPPAAPPPVFRGNGQHILFVDDEEPLARMGTAALQRLNYRVTPRINSREALALFAEQPAQFDLVITDLNMPGLNGTELARKLLAIRADLPVVLTTGYGAAVTAEVAREQGFRDLLPKPYDLRSLGEVTHRALNEANHSRRP